MQAALSEGCPVEPWPSATPLRSTRCWSPWGRRRAVHPTYRCRIPRSGRSTHRPGRRAGKRPVPPRSSVVLRLLARHEQFDRRGVALRARHLPRSPGARSVWPALRAVGSAWASSPPLWRFRRWSTALDRRDRSRYARYDPGGCRREAPVGAVTVQRACVLCAARRARWNWSCGNPCRLPLVMLLYILMHQTSAMICFSASFRFDTRARWTGRAHELGPRTGAYRDRRVVGTPDIHGLLRLAGEES